MLNYDFVSTRDVYHYTSLSRRNNDVIIALCVRWDRTTLPLRPRLHYIKYTVHWLYCSGCWFHLGSAYLHIITLCPVKIKNRKLYIWPIFTCINSTFALAQQCLFYCTFHPIRWAYLGDLTRKFNRGRQRVAPRGTAQPYLVILQELYARH